VTDSMLCFLSFPSFMGGNPLPVTSAEEMFCLGPISFK